MSEDPFQLPTVTIKTSKSPRLYAGHPWIFSSDIRKAPDELDKGAEVQFRDDKRRSLGVGFYNPDSKISGRILSRRKRELNSGFFRERLEAAIALRKAQEPKRPCYRLVNSEGDFLSGLIIDIYDRVAVIQISSLALDQRKQSIIGILDDLLDLDVILEKKDKGTRRFEGLDEGIEFHKGSAEQIPDTFQINDLKFHIDLVEGHKTGAYLDQQFNYDCVSRLAHPGRLLDCFTFNGGFALHAARRDDVTVEGVDQSRDALEIADRNAPPMTSRSSGSMATSLMSSRTRHRRSSQARHPPTTTSFSIRPPSPAIGPR